MVRVIPRCYPVIVMVLVLIGSCLAPHGGPTALGSRRLAAPAQYSSTNQYLPVLLTSNKPNSSLFGVEINPGMVSATIQQASDAAIGWVRYGNVNWSDVESAQGTRNWTALSSVDAELAALSQVGAHVIVTVAGTPSWAQQIPGSNCGPISPGALGAFASFMHDLVARYSVPPYNVRYWEIWNEPDAPTVVNNQGYGCWGDPSAAYYGGGAFGDMLKMVYPAIKAADPAAQVILGGLLLGCDPTHIPLGDSCASGNFFEGILQSGAGASFDMLAYHAYAPWSAQQIDWDLTAAYWDQTGGSLLGKLHLLQTVLAKYQVTNKQIIMDEGALLYYGDPAAAASTTYYQDQANYVVRLYARGLANGLGGVIWYTLNGAGWLNAGLLDAGQQPRPAYDTTEFLSSLLQHVSYQPPPLSTGNVEGYAFHATGVTYQVYWTNDSSTINLSLPVGARSLYDLTGSAITPAGTTVTVGFTPIIVSVNAP